MLRTSTTSSSSSSSSPIHILSWFSFVFLLLLPFVSPSTAIDSSSSISTDKPYSNSQDLNSIIQDTNTNLPQNTILNSDTNINTMAASALSKFYSFKPLDKAGNPYDLAQHLGKVILIVNVASKCGFTPQYDGLERLYQNHKEEGFVILGFPCNSFGGQEPGTEDEIQSFCRLNYGVTFPVLKKIDVNGNNADPLYEWLKAEKSGLMGLKRIKWNFEKFLVGRDGKVIERYASITKPDAMDSDIVKALKKASAENGAAESTPKAEL